MRDGYSELGIAQTEMTIVCMERHTSAHGAFGVEAFGIGTRDFEQLLATQTLPLKKLSMTVNRHQRLSEP